MRVFELGVVRLDGEWISGKRQVWLWRPIMGFLTHKWYNTYHILRTAFHLLYPKEN